MSDRFGSIEIEKPGIPTGTSGDVKGSRVRSRGSRKPKASRRPSDRSSRHWLWLGALVVIIALYSAAGFLGVPYYFTKIFPNRFYQNTGMVFIAENLQFNPYTFVLKTDATQIVDNSGKKIVALDSFFTSLRPFSLLRRDMVCTRVNIESPTINLVREYSGKYNLGQILGDAADDYDKEIIHFSDLPFFFSLNNITIKNGRIIFEDLPAAKTHTVENIELELPTFSNIPVKTESFMRPHFSATINGSPIELTGQARLSDTGDEHEVNKLTWALNDIDLQTYINYLPFSLPFDLVKGRAKGTIDLTFDSGAEKGKKFSFDFNLQLLDTGLNSNDGALSLTTPDAMIQGGLLPVSRTLAFTRIVLNKPVLDSSGPSLLANLATVLSTTADPEKPDLAKKQPINLAVEALTVEGGRLSLYTEKKDKEPFEEWQAVQLGIKDYFSAKERDSSSPPASFHLAATLADAPAQLSWNGTLDPSGNGSGTLKIDKYDAGLFFKNLELPYLQDIKGTATLEGQMELFPKRSTSSTILYKISKAKLTVDKCVIADKGQTFLSAQSIQAGPLEKSPENFDLGAITISDGVLTFQKGRLPGFLKKFTRKEAGPTLTSLSFSGSAAVQTGPDPETKMLFEQLQLKADALNETKPGKNLELAARSTSGEMVKLAGTVKLKPFQLASDIEFEKLPIGALMPLFSKAAFLTHTRGVMEGKGQLVMPDLGFTGDLATSAIKIDHPDFFRLNIQKSSFTALSFTAAPLQLKIDDVYLGNLDMNVDLSSFDGSPVADIRSFFQTHFPPHDPSAPNTKSRNNTPPLDIKSISFENAGFVVTDQRVNPQWNGAVKEFTGKVKDIHSAATAKASFFSSAGTLDEVPFTLSGNLDIFGEKDNSDYAFSISAYPLAGFRAQLQSRDGLNIDQTIFDLNYKSVSTNDMSRKTGEIVFTGLQAAPGSKETALTLAFLTNAKNNTRFEFDFEDQEPGRYESLFEQLLSLFNTIMIKGAVSPMLLAKGEFEELIGAEFIEFSPGEIMLSENGRNVLTRYTALLIAHPKIGLVLSGGCDSDKDFTAIKEQLEASEQKRVETINEKLAADWQAEKQNYEDKVAEQKKLFEQTGAISEIEMPQSLLEGFTPIEPAPVVVDEVMLLELAEKRLDIIQQFFTSQLALEPGRIKRISNTTQLPTKDQQVNGVKITLIPAEL